MNAVERSASAQRGRERANRGLDVISVDPQVGHQTGCGPAVGPNPDPSRDAAISELGEEIGRRVRDRDEDHVGVARVDIDAGELSEAGRESSCIGVIVGEALDVVFERVEASGSEHTDAFTLLAFTATTAWLNSRTQHPGLGSVAGPSARPTGALNSAIRPTTSP